MKAASYLLVTCCLLTFVCLNAVWAQDRTENTANGRLGTLPGADDSRQRSQLLASHIDLLGKTLDQAIEDLQDADIQSFARSYKRMVDAYGQLADHVGDASESIGEASGRILLARQSLTDVNQFSQADPAQRRKLNEDIGQIRAMLIGKLGSLRSRVETAPAQERRAMLQQIHGLVERINQLDRLGSSLRDGSRPILPGLAADDLAEQLATVESAIDEERRMLGVVAESVRMLVQNTSQEMRRTMWLLEVESQIPSQQVEQLMQTRRAVQSVLDEVATAQRRATDSALDILTRGEEPAAIPDQVELLQMADELLHSSEVGN